MTFASIPAGTTVFVDANVFVYAFAADPVLGILCTDLLERIELGQIDGCLSASTLSETAHRLMTLEACQQYGWPYAGIAQRLRRHPAELQKLTAFRAALDEITATGVRVFSVAEADVIRAADLCQQHGLLSNDALVVAIMEVQRVVHLASNDADFDRVPGITRYAPI
jgi:predicted nucleic acid-binding protein